MYCKAYASYNWPMFLKCSSVMRRLMLYTYFYLLLQLEMDFLSHEGNESKKMSLFQAWSRLRSFVLKIIREKDPEFFRDSTYTPSMLTENSIIQLIRIILNHTCPPTNYTLRNL